MVSCSQVVKDKEFQLQGHLIKNKTVIIIAHRMRTIANADRIVVLDDGKIVEQGMPEELIADNGLFKKMVDLQNLSGEWQI